MDALTPLEFDHRPRACFGCNSTSPKVGTSGKWDSPIVMLGESPGAQELKQRKPFVGPSGQLIEQCWPKGLAEQFSMEDCFIINAMQCFTKAASKDEARMLNSVAACRARVFELIGAAPRKVILSFGRWAAISVMQDLNFKIMSKRGTISQIAHPGRPGETCKVMHILHPAFLLRGQGNLNSFKSDIARGLQEGLGDKVKLTAATGYKMPEVGQLVNAEQVYSLISYIKDIYKETGEKVLVSADLETTGLSFWRNRPLCIGVFINQGEAKEDNIGYVIDWDRVLIEWRDRGQDIRGKNGVECVRGKNVPMFIRKELQEGKDNTFYEAIKDLFELPEEMVDYNWQNGKFDIKFLWEEGISARHNEDTFLLSYALDERPGGHGLEEIAQNLIGAPNYKDVLQEYLPNKAASYIHVPKPVLWKYLAQDVKNTQEIHPILRERVNDDAVLKKLYERTLVPSSTMLAKIEQRGFYVDLDHVQENDAALLIEIEQAQQTVSESAGYYINPNSPQQVQACLYDDLKLTLKGKRPTDTTKEVLDKLYEETRHPVLKAIRNYRSLVKAHSTYVQAIPKHIDPAGRVHSTYNNGRTTTGRLASEDPNLQNIPRLARYRRMYRASPGMILIEGDYNTAELRGLAAFSRDKTLTEIFLDDKRNLHDEVAIERYGPNFTSDQRIRAKAVNFGIPYGREAFSIADEFDMEVSEAQSLIDSWFGKFPEAEIFINKCRNAPLNGQTLVSPFGRKRRPGIVNGEMLKKLQNEFANFLMQSTISDFTLHAAMALQNELLKYGAYIVNLIHDSILVECYPEFREDVIRLMRYYMEGVPKLWLKTPISFKVDFKVGTHWGMLKGC